MLGWDVGYVWPLLEGVVVSQTRDTWDMGNPHEASTQTAVSATSSQNAQQGVQHPRPRPTVVPDVDPPPYESVATNESSNLTEQQTATNQSVNNHRSSNNESSSGNRRNRTNASSRHRSSNTSNQRYRPPKWPHKASSVFACLSCVIGLCNVSRFSVLVYIYKGEYVYCDILLIALNRGTSFLNDFGEIKKKCYKCTGAGAVLARKPSF